MLDSKPLWFIRYSSFYSDAKIRSKHLFLYSKVTVLNSIPRPKSVTHNFEGRYYKYGRLILRNIREYYFCTNSTLC